jgi:hypothetical protein
MPEDLPGHFLFKGYYHFEMIENTLKLALTAFGDLIELNFRRIAVIDKMDINDICRLAS